VVADVAPRAAILAGIGQRRPQSPAPAPSDPQVTRRCLPNPFKPAGSAHNQRRLDRDDCRPAGGAEARFEFLRPRPRRRFDRERWQTWSSRCRTSAWPPRRAPGEIPDTAPARDTSPARGFERVVKLPTRRARSDLAAVAINFWARPGCAIFSACRKTRQFAIGPRRGNAKAGMHQNETRAPQRAEIIQRSPFPRVPSPARVCLAGKNSRPSPAWQRSCEVAVRERSAEQFIQAQQGDRRHCRCRHQDLRPWECFSRWMRTPSLIRAVSRILRPRDAPDCSRQWAASDCCR
jgi:hypothetical protein